MKMKRMLISVLFIVTVMICLPASVQAGESILLNSTFTGGELSEGSYQLTEDIVLSGAVRISYGADVSIDLNGYVLDRGLNEADGEGYVIYNNGTLTITDSNPSAAHAGDYASLPEGGCITGGNIDGDGGCIYNYLYGKLTMNGGSISGNNAVYDGAGVYNWGIFRMNAGSITDNTSGGSGGGVVNHGGQMMMAGGIISENKAVNGGGIFVDTGTVTMTGGSIINNDADYGGGIYSEGTFVQDGGSVTFNNAGHGEYAFVGDSFIYMKGIVEGGYELGVSGKYITGCTVSSWDELQRTIDKYDIISIQLQSDIMAGETDQQIEITDGKYIALDLNGHVMDRRLDAKDSYGSVLVNNKSTLIIRDTCPENSHADYDILSGSLLTSIPDGGVITGGYTAESGGGIFNDGGMLILEGGTITGNRSDLFGSGVNVEGDGTFEMRRGAVSGNGGEGISLYSFMENKNTLIITGGIVEGNKGSGINCRWGDVLLTDALVKGNEKSGIVVSDSNLVIEGKTEISGNRTEDFGGGIEIRGGTVTMSDGCIKENYAHHGGGVYNCGTFTMKKGSIADNKAEYEGGGVTNHCTFVMKGGDISNNRAVGEHGGGVYNNNSSSDEGCSFTMTGGSIKGNVCGLFGTNNDGGAGVYSGETGTVNFNISGSPVITDNKLVIGESDPADSNVMIRSQNVITITGRLAKGASVSVTPTEDPTVIASFRDASANQYFASDDPDYTIYFEAASSGGSGRILLCRRKSPEICFDSLKIGNGSFADGTVKCTYDGNQLAVIRYPDARVNETSVSVDQWNEQWYDADSKPLEASPSDAGTYYLTFRPEYNNILYIDAQEPTEKIRVIIGKAVPEFTAPVFSEKLTYNGSAQDLIRELGSSEHGTFSYNVKTDTETAGTDYDRPVQSPQGMNAGKYIISYRLTGDSNHCDYVFEPAEVVIRKASASGEVPEKVTEVYTGKPIALVLRPESINATGGSFEFSLDGEVFTEAVPTGTEAGKYDVYYRFVVSDEDNYDEPDPDIKGILESEIVRKNQRAPERITITFVKTDNEQYEATVGVPAGKTEIEYSYDGGITWSGMHVLSVNAGEELKVYARYMAGGNYSSSPEAAASDSAPAVPDAPELELTFEKVGDGEYLAVITEIENGEYSFDGVTFSSVNTRKVFEEEEVTAYARIAETEEMYASRISSTVKTAPSDEEDIPNNKYVPDYPLYVGPEPTMYLSPYTSDGGGAFSAKGSEPETAEETALNVDNEEAAGNEQGGHVTVVLTIDSCTAGINGKKIQLDTPAVILNERTMLPARFVAEALGAEVEWIEETRTVIITLDDTVIVLTIDSNIATVNGEAVELDAPAVIMNERTMLPIRFIAESLGASVEWDDAARTVTIEK